MTYKEVQNLLQNFRPKKRRVEALGIYIRKARKELDGVSALNYDNIVVKSSQDNNAEARYIKSLDRLNDLEKRYDNLMEDIHNDENIIFGLMEKLPPTEYQVILHRFLEELSRAKTARLMKYSEDNIKHLQQQALKKMCQ